MPVSFFLAIKAQSCYNHKKELMNMTKRKLYALVVLLILLGTLFSRGFNFNLPEPAADVTDATGHTEETIAEDGWYYNAADVSLYLHTYGHLPGNYMTKDEARKLGWEGGSVEEYAPGRAIGGDEFGNREGLLPEKDGRIYYECDIGTKGADSRGASRIVFSNDGLIYFTRDHYESFELLYGEE